MRTFQYCKIAVWQGANDLRMVPPETVGPENTMLYYLGIEGGGKDCFYRFQIYALRARHLAQKRKWALPHANCLHRDCYDDANPLYVLVLDAAGNEVLGAARLLPTTDRHILAGCIENGTLSEARIKNPLIWECGEFYLDTQKAHNYGSSPDTVANELLLGILTKARARGLTHIISFFEPYQERFLRRSGYHFDPFGEPFFYNARKHMAALFEISDTIIETAAQNWEASSNPCLKSPDISPEIVTPLTRSPHRRPA